MIDTRDDERLENLFAEQRRADRTGTPPFDRVWASATASKRRRYPISVFATASGCTAIAVVIVVMMLRHQAPAGLAAGAQLAAWRSPTESLLRGPGADILSDVPNVHASLVRPETLQPVIGGGTP